MPKKPPLSELEFLKLSGNFLELSRKLEALDCACPDVTSYADYVGRKWLRLAEMHLAETKKLLAVDCSRAAYSRAYYAAYNASKGMRYLVKGYVSLRGDDHGKASADLPDDFPDVAKWSRRLTALRQNRLRADYDNWSRTRYELTMTPSESFEGASQFIRAAKSYLRSKKGMKL